MDTTRVRSTLHGTSSAALVFHRIALTPQDRDGPVDPVSWTPRRSPDMNAHIQTGMGIPPPSPQASLYVGLFNTADSTQPHPNLMVNFIHVFFDRLGSTYPFLSYEVIFERFLNHGLPNLLANAIAASAAR